MNKKIFSTLAGVGFLIASNISYAAPVTINAGWDIFRTKSANWNFGGSIGSVAFIGVPIGTSTIGSIPGAQLPYPPTPPLTDYGMTDTIVHRYMDGTGGGSVTLTNNGDQTLTTINMTALQLVSATQINLGFGFQTYFATLSTVQSPSGLPAGICGALGDNQMCITYNGVDGGTFESNLLFNIDFHENSLNGLVRLSIQNSFTGTTGVWSTTPNPTAIVVAGLDNSNFFLGVGPGGSSTPIETCHNSSGCPHGTEIVPTPIPAAIWLFGSGIAGLIGVRNRKSKNFEAVMA